MKKYKKRISESVETALALSDGVIYFYDNQKKESFIFSSKFASVLSQDLLLKR